MLSRISVELDELLKHPWRSPWHLVFATLTYFMPNERHSESAQSLVDLTDLPVHISQVFLQSVFDFLEQK
jgi:hypothetical protein